MAQKTWPKKPCSGPTDKCHGVQRVSADKRIPPDAQRAMAKRAGSPMVEAKGSHAIYFSQPKAVGALIEQATSKDTGAAVAL